MDRYFIGPADGGPLPTEKGGGADGGEKAQTRKALSAADGAAGDPVLAVLSHSEMGGI